MLHSLYFSTFLFLVIYYYHAETDNDDCISIESCNICIQTPNCVWCAKPQNLSSGSSVFSRCHQQSESTQKYDEWVQNCGNNFLVAPKNNVKTVEDKSFTNKLNSAYINPLSVNEDEEEIIQMKPQYVKLSLRIDEPQSLTVTLKRINDYPLDLYYLKGFAPYKVANQKRLTDYGVKIGKRFHRSKPTRDFRYGFGAFADNGQAAERLAGTCQHFKNIVPLSRKPLSLENNELPISGSLNALVQVMKCRDLIPWRKYSRRFILFSTDVDYYDDKEKDDEKIKFGDEDYYDYKSYLSLFDSSAIQELKTAAREENVNIIFAVNSRNWNAYRMLPFVIQGALVVELASDYSNIHSIIKNAYEKFSSRIELVDDAKPPSVIKYFNRCNSVLKEEVNNPECDIHEEEVKFRIEVVAMNVWDSGGKHPRKQRVRISPVGLPDTLTLDLEFITQCDLYQRNSLRPRKIDPAVLSSEFMCKENDHSEVCSGRGECLGGTCVCDRRENPLERIVGQFCECTNFLCDRTEGLLCSGPYHGVCICDRCFCKPGYTGRACECEGSNLNCVVPGTHKICSNQGICECNQCKCFETSMGKFSGKYCEHCPNCTSKCLEIKPCVECRLYGFDQSDYDECLKCKQNFEIQPVPFIDFDGKSEVMCSYLDSDGCRFSFVYGYEGIDSSILYVKAATAKDCPKA